MRFANFCLLALFAVGSITAQDTSKCSRETKFEYFMDRDCKRAVTLRERVGRFIKKSSSTTMPKDLTKLCDFIDSREERKAYLGNKVTDFLRDKRDELDGEYSEFIQLLL